MEIIIASIAIGTALLIALTVKTMDSYATLAMLISAISGFGAVIGGFVLVLGIYTWVSAEHKARLINQQIGTSYTAEDIFFASGYIDDVRELHRKRIEVNGDLLREK